MPSIFETSYYLCDSLSIVGQWEQSKAIADKIGKYRLPDGSYGEDSSNLASTYFALAVLALAGASKEKRLEAYRYVTSRAVGSGGFTMAPGAGLAFMDETYYSIMTLELLGEKPENTAETIGFIADCQNENGGFRRARASGISTFETSYYAVESLGSLMKTWTTL